jgi:hypothetical protein
MEDAQDLKSWGYNKPCGFKSHHRHRVNKALTLTHLKRCVSSVTVFDMITQVQPDAPTAEPRRVRLPKTWPVEIRNRDAIAKIYKAPTIVRGEKYRTFFLSYSANAKRQHRRFMVFAKAKQEADRVTEQKAQGAPGRSGTQPPA